MKDIRNIRAEIDDIDSQLTQLFQRRLEIVKQVAESKHERGAPVTDPARERDILSRVTAAVDPEYEHGARLFFNTLFSISKARQRVILNGEKPLVKAVRAACEAKAGKRFPHRAVVACPGTEGAYAQQATSLLFPIPTILYFDGFEAVFEAVEKGVCPYGILPIENSAAGSVTAVYDLMVRHKFHIVRALRLKIDHVLLAPRGTKLEDVKEISSHPNALAQCSKFLFAHPQIKTVPELNTAMAAQSLAKSGRRDVAVIASRECAELYGLEVIDGDVSDTLSNFTRFILISKRLEIYPDANKLSIIMNLGHRAGALADVLIRFAAAGVNLTKLESRPVPGSDFEFSFVFDVEASPRDPAVVRLLSGFASDSSIERFAFLGAYAER